MYTRLYVIYTCTLICMYMRLYVIKICTLIRMYTHLYVNECMSIHKFFIIICSSIFLINALVYIFFCFCIHIYVLTYVCMNDRVLVYKHVYTLYMST